MVTIPSGSIVVGVDETALTGTAVRWAAEQARLEARPLVLAHAIAPYAVASGAYGFGVAPLAMAEERRAGEEVLTRAADVVGEVAPRVAITRVLELGEPRHLLAELSVGAHLLVLGSRGRGPALSRLLGSVAVAVVRHAECPVVVHRPTRAGLVRGGVVAAVDATADAVPVLEHAFHQASLRDLPLHVVHYVMDPRSALVGAPMTGDLGELTERHDLAISEAMAGLRERYPDVWVGVRTPLGLPDLDVATTAAHADLLVVGHHRTGVLERLLGGTVSEAVLEHATCPVALVPVGSGT